MKERTKAMDNIFGMHTHHIVFRSHGGLDFELNLVRMTQEEHEGNNGPHLCRERDLELKREMQGKLQELFLYDQEYTIEEISRKLGRTKRYFAPHFKKVPLAPGSSDGYLGYDVVKKLMGGRLY